MHPFLNNGLSINCIFIKSTKDQWVITCTWMNQVYFWLGFLTLHETLTFLCKCANGWKKINISYEVGFYVNINLKCLATSHNLMKVIMNIHIINNFMKTLVKLMNELWKLTNVICLVYNIFIHYDEPMKHVHGLKWLWKTITKMMIIKSWKKLVLWCINLDNPHSFLYEHL